MRDSRDYMLQQAAEQKAMKKEYLRELYSLPEGRLILSQIGNGAYYSEIKDGKRTYLGSGTHAKVKALQKRRFLENAIGHIDHNLHLMNTYINEYEPIDRTSILQELPKAYRGEAEWNMDEKDWENEPMIKIRDIRMRWSIRR